MTAVYTAAAGDFTGLGEEAITIEGTTAAAADLKAINLATSGAVNASSVQTITGSSADVKAVYTAGAGEFTGLGNEAVTLNTDPSTADLKAINAATSGVISLSNYGLALSGSAADLAIALSGTFGAAYNGAITIEGTTAAAADLKAINLATSGAVNASSVQTITGSSADVKAVYTAGAGEFTGLGNEAVTLNTDPSTADLKAINAATSGVISLSNYGLALSGSAADLAIALSGTFGAAYTGAITVIGSASVAEANLIDAATSGVVTATLNSGTLASFAALTGTANAYTITVNDVLGSTLSASALAALGGKTTGPVTVNSSVTVTGTADEVLAAMVTPSTSVSIPTGSTINATGYTNQDFSSINAVGYTLNVSASTAQLGLIQPAPGALGLGKLVNADQVTLTVPTGNGVQYANLKTITSLGPDLDDFTLNADDNNAVASVRLSEALSLSQKANVFLEPTTASGYDTVIVESNISSSKASVGNTGLQPDSPLRYSNTTTWDDLGFGGVDIYGFTSNVDSFGVVDSSGSPVFSTWQLGAADGGAYLDDGMMYLITSRFFNLDRVYDIRNYIGTAVIEGYQGVDFGFALLGGQSGSKVDIGLYHAKWLGSDGVNPARDDANLLVTRLAVLQDVDVSATLGLTSVLAAPNFIANSLPTGLA